MLSTSGRRAGRGAGRARLGRHAVRHARDRDTAGVPAAGRNRFARLGSQRRGAARRPAASPAAPCRCRTPAAAGWCGNAATEPSDSALGRAAAAPGADEGEPVPAGRGPPGRGLVAGRLGQGDADPGPPARAGPGSVRQADRVVPGGPAPAGRDTGGHRRRRGDAEPARRGQPRSDRAAGQGRSGQGRADRGHDTASRCSAASASPPSTSCTTT